MSVQKFWRDASDRLTFSLNKAPAAIYKPLCEAIANNFGLSPHSGLVTDGYDVIFQDYARGEQIIGMEWDIWSDFTVVANSTQSEPLVQEIGAWLLESEWADYY